MKNKFKKRCNFLFDLISEGYYINNFEFKSAWIVPFYHSKHYVEKDLDWRNNYIYLPYE
jgi:hypothetical protein